MVLGNEWEISTLKSPGLKNEAKTKVSKTAGMRLAT